MKRGALTGREVKKYCVRLFVMNPDTCVYAYDVDGEGKVWVRGRRHWPKLLQSIVFQVRFDFERGTVCCVLACGRIILLLSEKIVVFEFAVRRLRALGDLSVLVNGKDIEQPA